MGTHKSLLIFIKLAQACLSFYCMWWHALQSRWKCPIRLLEKLNNLFAAHLLLDWCTLFMRCAAQLALKAAVLCATNSFAWHLLFFIISLCIQCVLSHFQTKTEWRINAGDVWEKCHDLDSTAKLQKQLYLNTIKAMAQGKQAVHHITFVYDYINYYDYEYIWLYILYDVRAAKLMADC